MHRKTIRAGNILFIFVFLLLLLGCASAEPYEEAIGEPEAEEQEGEPAPVVDPHSTFEPQPTALPTEMPPQPAIMEERRLLLEWPSTIRAGDSDILRLVLEMDEEGRMTPTVVREGHEIRGEPVLIPNLYDTHNVMVEARLDMAGMDISPTGEVGEPLLPGESVTFFWSVRPKDVGYYTGTLWVYLRYIPLDGSQGVRSPLSAQRVEINVVDLFGLGGFAARVVGIVGTIFGSMIGLDNVLPWLWKRFKPQKD